MSLRKEAIITIGGLLSYSLPDFDLPLLKEIQRVLSQEQEAAILMSALQAVTCFIEKQAANEENQSQEEERVRKGERTELLVKLNFVELLESVSSRVHESSVTKEITDIMDCYLVGTEDPEEGEGEEEEKIEL